MGDLFSDEFRFAFHNIVDGKMITQLSFFTDVKLSLKRHTILCSELYDALPETDVSRFSSGVFDQRLMFPAAG